MAGGTLALSRLTKHRGRVGTFPAPPVRRAPGGVSDPGLSNRQESR